MGFHCSSKLASRSRSVYDDNVMMMYCQASNPMHVSRWNKSYVCNIPVVFWSLSSDTKAKIGCLPRGRVGASL